MPLITREQCVLCGQDTGPVRLLRLPTIVSSFATCKHCKIYYCEECLGGLRFEKGGFLSATKYFATVAARHLTFRAIAQVGGRGGEKSNGSFSRTRPAVLPPPDTRRLGLMTTAPYPEPMLQTLLEEWHGSKHEAGCNLGSASGGRHHYQSK